MLNVEVMVGIKVNIKKVIKIMNNIKSV